MKREILFKGRRLDDGLWVEGFYVQHWVRNCRIQPQEFKDRFLKHYIMRDGNVLTRSGEPPWVPTEVSPESVCQFTEYVDYDSRRIFESDVLQVKTDTDGGYSLLVVSLINGRWKALTYDSMDLMMQYGWSDKARPIDSIALDDLCVFKNKCECWIVGNIYSMPTIRAKTPEIKMEVDT